MLYKAFTIIMMFSSAIGLLVMCDKQLYEFIIFPLSIIISGSYYFFDLDDKEYLKRKGIDPEDFNWLCPDYYGDYYSNSFNGYNTQHTKHDSYEKKQNSTYYPTNPKYERTVSRDGTTRINNTEYKRLKDKCKKSVNITISK